jgi:hypothetical protein
MLCLTGCSRKKTNKELLTGYLLSKRYTSSLDSDVIHHLLDTLLSGSGDDNKFTINRPYDPSVINVYIINGDDSRTRSDEQVYRLLSNCSYIGQRIIVVDANFLETFLPKLGFQKNTPGQVKSEILMDDFESFYYWTIGHELGHLMCGHLEGHFDNSSLDRFVRTSTLGNAQELQADSFFVHSIINRKMLRNSIESTMLNILNVEIERKVGPVKVMGVGLLYDYSNQQVVTYARQPTHPEYVVRLSRMLELSSRAARDTGLQNLIGGFIRQMKEANNKKEKN